MWSSASQAPPPPTCTSSEERHRVEARLVTSAVASTRLTFQTVSLSGCQTSRGLIVVLSSPQVRCTRSSMTEWRLLLFASLLLLPGSLEWDFWWVPGFKMFGWLSCKTVIWEMTVASSCGFVSCTFSQLRALCQTSGWRTTTFAGLVELCLMGDVVGVRSCLISVLRGMTDWSAHLRTRLLSFSLAVSVKYLAQLFA